MEKSESEEIKKLINMLTAFVMDLEKSKTNLNFFDLVSEFQGNFFDYVPTQEYLQLMRDNDNKQFSVVSKYAEPKFYAIKYPDTIQEQFIFSFLMQIYELSSGIIKEKSSMTFVNDMINIISKTKELLVKTL